jgi:CHAD domain-containing protein
MATGSTLAGSRPEHRGVQYWMERVLKELEKVRTAPEPDAVHDLRVAIRRCRSVGAVMQEVDPDPAWPEMRKLGRKLFRQLGELRDTQVLEEWTKQLGAESDPVRERLLVLLEAKEKEQQSAALRAVAKFNQRSWKKLERRLQRRSRMVPPGGPAAECLALERMEAAKLLHVRALRSEKPQAWHGLRIAVKRFRYTVESLLPRRYEEWGENLKRLQDLLGEVHDLDVLATTIAQSAADLEQARPAWAERIAIERHERIESYRHLAVGEGGVWQEWKRGLPEGDRLEGASLARLRVTPRALEVKSRRTTTVSRLALKVFDALSKVHAAPVFANKHLRKIMRGAATLHGIGAGLDARPPQKAARKYLRSMTVPPGWTETEWEILANVVRYHRGSVPQPKHKAYARFTTEEQKIICTLAGVLRMARVLRRCGVESPVAMRVEKSVDAFILHVPGLVESEENAARLAAGKFLLENSVERPVIVKAAPTVQKVLQLPRKEVMPQVTAAASD